jgi:hypothetical protein
MGKHTQPQALASTYKNHIDWVIDSGASKHVTKVSFLYNIHPTYPHCRVVQPLIYPV